MFAARENKARAVSKLLSCGAQFDVRNYEDMVAEDLTLDHNISLLIRRYATCTMEQISEMDSEPYL